jgi:dCMP deaminase
MEIAHRVAQESHAVRAKVGAVFVSTEGVMSIGINGMPAGDTNECEDKVYDNTAGGWLDIDDLTRLLPYEDEHGRYRLVTKASCSHAEENLFQKLMRQGVSTKDGIIFQTLSPCLSCASIMLGAGIKEVYYAEEYRNTDGIEWLVSHNVICKKL